MSRHKKSLYDFGSQFPHNIHKTIHKRCSPFILMIENLAEIALWRNINVEFYKMTFLQVLGNGVFRQKGQSHATVDQLGNGDSTVYKQTMLEQQALDGRQLIEPGIAKSTVLRSDDVVLENFA